MPYNYGNMIDKIFFYRGQILLTEKVKREEFPCDCKLCKRRDPRDRINGGNYISEKHLPVIRIFLPFITEKKLQKINHIMYKAKEQQTIQRETKKEHKELMDKTRNYSFIKSKYRLYPLDIRVYNSFADYLWKKLGSPKLGMRNLSGVQWGTCYKEMRSSSKYGSWVTQRKFGISIIGQRLWFDNGNERRQYRLMKNLKVAKFNENLKFIKKKLP